MSRGNISALFALLFFVSAAVEASEVSAFQVQNLYGRWHCQYAMKDASMMMKIDYDIEYTADGQARGNGTVRLRMPHFPLMEYSLSNHATWAVKADSLILSSVGFKLVNRSHPELDQLLNLQSMFAQTVRESSTILELTPSTLIARSDSYGGVYSCAKTLSNS